MPNPSIDNDRLLLRIAVTRPVREIYSYTVPHKFVSRAEVGRRVMVPFRNSKVIGYILEIETLKDEKGLKEILDILDAEPLFHHSMVPFFRWMADYYLYPIGRLIKSALPAGINVTDFKTGRITQAGLMALNSVHLPLEERGLLTWIKGHPGKRFPSPLRRLEALERKGWAVIESRAAKRGVGPLTRKFVRVRDGIDLVSISRKDISSFKAKNEAEFLETISSSTVISLKDLSSKFSNGPYLVNKWIKAGVIERYNATVFRDPAGKILVPSPVPRDLFDQQEEALARIKELLDKGTFATCLVHGVTGSGKTEVYYRAVRDAITLGLQAILLVPEIALAIYMEVIFRSRLNDRVAIFHSGLSRGERYDQWMRISRGDVDLVIGARSALFAPLPRLGLIIIDEEYDSSYKQEEGPRYQARDAAVVRGRIEEALVILGAGTPSVQSFHNTTIGRYHLISMPDRVEKRPLPEMEIVDMKKLTESGSTDGVLSPILGKAIERNLADRRQTILFLNRRGFSRVYLCRSCGEAIKCPNCDLTLTFHLKDSMLTCHYCGFNSQPLDKCPSCRHKGMKAFGFGTERLEQELGERFPTASIARMDRDSTRRKGQSYDILKRFSDRETDILVGTQMITKGYDFHNVTLVGVIAADLSLGFPDFRAAERTFQLISQVAGRAGRGEQRGRVIVQTFNPGHYAITTARDHDYESFFQREMELREVLRYPPFSYLACLRFRGNNRSDTEAMAQWIGEEIKAILESWPKKGKTIQLLGPAEAPLAKLRGKYRWQILLKSRGTELLHYLLNEVRTFSGKMLRSSGVSMKVDVDPYQML